MQRLRGTCFFFKYKVSKQRNQLLKKDAFLSGYQLRVVVLEQELASIWSDVKRPTPQHTADKDLLDSVHTALAHYRTDSRQHALVSHHRT